MNAGVSGGGRSYAAQCKATGRMMTTVSSTPRLELRPDHTPPLEQPVSPKTREIMHREIIVSGDDALSKTIAEELRGAGARIIKINTAADLNGANLQTAPQPSQDHRELARREKRGAASDQQDA